MNERILELAKPFFITRDWYLILASDCCLTSEEGNIIPGRMIGCREYKNGQYRGMIDIPSNDYWTFSGETIEGRMTLRETTPQFTAIVDVEAQWISPSHSRGDETDKHTK